MIQNLEYYNNMKHNSLTDKAYDILEELIVTLQLKQGQSYSVLELSKIIGVGRTPVREAIKHLEATHILSIIPRSGIVISNIELEKSFLQLEVRSMLEKLIAVRAAKFSTPDERILFTKLADRYEKANKEENALESVRIDNEFNHFAAKCSRNIYAESALMPL